METKNQAAVTELDAEDLRSRAYRDAMRAARARKGWTQAQAAVRLGTTLGWWGVFEREPRLMSAQIAPRVAEVLGLVPFDEFKIEQPVESGLAPGGAQP